MNSLNVQARQASLNLPPVNTECDLDRRQRAVEDREESHDDLHSARGIVIAVGLSALMWIIVLATVTFF